MAKKMTLDEFLAKVKGEYEALPDSAAEFYGEKAVSTKIGNDYSTNITKYLSRETILSSAAWVNREISTTPEVDYPYANVYDMPSGAKSNTTSIVGATPGDAFQRMMQMFANLERELNRVQPINKICSYSIEGNLEYDYEDAIGSLELTIYYTSPATYNEALAEAKRKLYEVQSTWREEANKRVAAMTTALRLEVQRAKEEEDVRKQEEKKKKEFDRLLKKLPKETLEALLKAKG